MTSNPMSKGSTAIGWYKPDTFERLREISSDRDNLPDTFEDWRKLAEEASKNLKAQGIDIVKVLIDPEQLLAFANSKGRPVDGKLRAEFAAITLRKNQGAPTEGKGV